MTTQTVHAPFPPLEVIARDLPGYAADVRGLHPDREPSQWRLNEEKRQFEQATYEIWIVPEQRRVIGRPRAHLKGWPERVERILDRVRAGEFFTSGGLADWRRVTVNTGHQALYQQVITWRDAERCQRTGCASEGDWFAVEDEHACSAPRTLQMIEYGIDIDWFAQRGEWQISGSEWATYSGSDAREFSWALEAAADLVEQLNRQEAMS